MFWYVFDDLQQNRGLNDKRTLYFETFYIVSDFEPIFRQTNKWAVVNFPITFHIASNFDPFINLFLVSYSSHPCSSFLHSFNHIIDETECTFYI